MANLRSRMVSLTKNASLIKSYSNHTQSYIYDQALAIIAFSHQKDLKSARQLMKGLEQIQRDDGSYYFSYYLDGTSPYPAEGDKRYAGAIAWVAIAGSHYQQQFNSKEFEPGMVKVLNYLQSQLQSMKDSNLALRFAPTDLAGTDWNEFETAALEHNLDALAAFRNYEKVTGKKIWKKEIEGLKNFSLSLWDEERGHFWSGINLRSTKINREEFYLDNQSWSTLALEEKDLKRVNLVSALGASCDNLQVNHDGVTGFMDRKPANRKSEFQFVWSEGTAGQILALERARALEQKACPKIKNEKLLSELKKMQKSDGGIAYATKGNDPDFSSASSVAGTTWYYFALNNFNPFHLVE